MQKRRSIHHPGSPDDLKGLKPAANPDGCTPVELPSKSSSLRQPMLESPARKPPAEKKHR